MKKRFTGQQIISVLRKDNLGAKTSELYWKYGCSNVTYPKRTLKLGGMNGADALRLGRWKPITEG